jgi:F-type H+-transporting ATPase subunit c
MRGMLRILGMMSAVMLTSVCAFAETAASTGGAGYTALAAGLGLGLAVVGGALSQGKICAAAMEGIARNPNAQEKMFVSMIIGLVLIESLVIYMLVVSFTILG